MNTTAIAAVTARNIIFGTNRSRLSCLEPTMLSGKKNSTAKNTTVITVVISAAVFFVNTIMPPFALKYLVYFSITD
jgi:hypothetical protein